MRAIFCAGDGRLGELRGRPTDWHGAQGAAPPPKSEPTSKAIELKRYHKIDHSRNYTPHCLINEEHSESDARKGIKAPGDQRTRGRMDQGTNAGNLVGMSFDYVLIYLLVLILVVV